MEKSSSNYITMLGTGNALVTRCYNTCFTIHVDGRVARLAERLGVRNLILYHTEDRTLETRRKRYSDEAKTIFSGQVWVPDDLDRIVL